MSGFSRRQFLKVGGAAVGAAAVGTAITTKWFGLDGDVVARPGTEADKVVPTFCELCFWKCGVLAHVKDGRVVKITGNPAHPLSRGRLCPRGTGGMGLAHDPDRLVKPLLRRDRRGSQEFEAVAWDVALDKVAEGMKSIKDRYGPEAMVLFSHGYGGSWFKHLLKAYGSANIAAPSYAQCRGPRESAFQVTCGATLGSPETLDLAHSRAIALIGSHLGENMHNTQVQDFATAVGNGVQLIVVDPRYSTAAGKAKHWLPIKPGTDLALLLAWMHVLVAEGLYDRDYVEQYTVGFDSLRAHLADKTPEWAWTHTGIRPKVIVETARVLGGARPASLVHPGRHVVWYGDDFQRSRAIAILNGLLGSWGRRGGIFLPVQFPVPPHPGPKPHPVKKRAPDAPRGTVYPFADDVLAHGLVDASVPGTADYDVKGWMVYGTNLIQAMPRPEAVKAALQHLDLVVTVDVLPAEIVGWSDVVLPEASYLERYDDLDNSPWRDPYLALRQPAIDPVGESKPGWWIAKELGRRLGLDEYFPWTDVESYLKTRVAAAKVDWDTLAARGVVVGPAKPTVAEDGAPLAFATPSTRLEIFSQRVADAGLPGLPDFTPPEEPPEGMFRLLFGRAPTHTFGRTTNNRVLGEIKSTNELWLNARVAAELGLKDGEDVVCVNQDGVRSQPLPLKATQRIRPDCVYMVHGFGHDAKGLNFARNRGADDSRLVTRIKVDPAMGGTGMNVNFVRVERAGEAA